MVDEVQGLTKLITMVEVTELPELVLVYVTVNVSDAPL